MFIGKAGPATTSISTADATSVEIRGRNLCRDLMGRVRFTEFFYLLVTGNEPTKAAISYASEVGKPPK
jgi:citrate synthase